MSSTIRTVNNEVRFNLFNQYSRRENIEINNISKSIGQKDLEKYVIAILHSIGVTIELYDIVAAHRIGAKINGKNRKVILE